MRAKPSPSPPCSLPAGQSQACCEVADFGALSQQDLVIRLSEALAAIADKDRQLAELRLVVTDLSATQCKPQVNGCCPPEALANDRLREVDGRFRAIMQDIPELAVQGYAADGTVTFWNPASERLYGFTHHEALGGNLLDLIIPPSMRDGVVRAMQLMFATGEPIPAGELVLQTKGGAPVHVFSSHALICPLNGPPEMFCLDIDLSRQKRTEHALSDSELRYRTMVELSVDAIAVCANGAVVYVNPTAVKLFGATSATDLVGKPVSSLICQDDLDSAMSRIAQIPVSPTVLPVVGMRCVRLDGSIVDVEVQGTAIPFSGVPSIQVVIRDMTERIRIARALHESEQRFRTMVEWSPNPCAVHRDRTIIYANPAAVRLFGAQSSADLIGTSIVSRVHPDSLQSQLERAELAERGVPLSVTEARFARMDGAPIDVEVQGIAIQFDGEPAILVTWRDITERNLAVKAHMTAAAEAEASQQLRKSFVNVVAHSLRSPMQAMATAADIIEMSMLDPSNCQSNIAQAVSQIRSSNDLMRVQLRDLQQWARSTDTQLTIQARPFLLADLVAPVERAFGPVARAKGLELLVEVVPESAPTLVGDHLRLLQSVNNLVDNAIKYTLSGGVKVRLWTDSDGLAIEVSDSGIGIETIDLANVIKPFKRGTNAPKHVPGTGLGLAVVANMAKLMGGSLVMAKAWPHGTNALLRLPLFPP